MSKSPKKRLVEILVDRSIKLLHPWEQFKLLAREFWELKLARIVTYTLLFLLSIPVFFFFYAKPVPQTDINYGVNFSDKYARELGLDWKDAYIKILDGLGVKNLRLIAYWDQIEKEKGVYDYSDVKWQLEEAQKRNASVIMTIGRKVPRYPECFEPDWWRQMTDEKAQNEALYKYVENTVTALRDYPNIKMWQVENEPFFSFGVCTDIKKAVVEREVQVTRAVDNFNRPIIIQDSGEGGFWRPSYKLGDYLAISMYRKIWYDFWGALLGEFTYFKYPLAHWTYKIKADLVGIPYQKIVVTELQAEPWGPGSTVNLSKAEKDKTMSRQDFISVIDYAQKAGFKDIYFWGAEWWLFEKEKFGNSFYWDTARALFN